MLNKGALHIPLNALLQPNSKFMLANQAMPIEWPTDQEPQIPKQAQEIQGLGLKLCNASLGRAEGLNALSTWPSGLVRLMQLESTHWPL